MCGQGLLLHGKIFQACFTQRRTPIGKLANPWYLSYVISRFRTQWWHPFVFLFRFRQEYRLERKVLNELSVDPDTFSINNDDLSDLIVTAPSGHSPAARHSISRVVVLHNNKLETFCTPNEVVQPTESLNGDFFDNDSFWSGSLTWY
jgi:hypothetical protein